MIKIAICDDQKEYLDTAKNLITQYGAEKDVPFDIIEFSNPSDLLDETVEYDIYLLDVCMPGITGMSLATELRAKRIESPIVFLTSYSDYAVQAFGVNATHYIVKPYTKEEFFKGVDKALAAININSPKTIKLKIEGGYKTILVYNIVWSESNDHYQIISLLNGEKLYVRISATELADKLSPFGCFYQCGKTYIINLDYIDKLSSNSAALTSGDNLVIPRTAFKGLQTAYFDYFGRR